MVSFSHKSLYVLKKWLFNRSKVNLQLSLNRIVDLESPMLYTKIQPKSFHGSGEKYFYVSLFSTYLGMVAILFNGADPFD